MAAAEKLTEDRIAARDEALARMPDDLLGLAEYLCANRSVSAPLRAREFERLWLLLDFVAREVDRVRLAAILSAKDAGRSYRSMAPTLGVKGRAGVEARRARLESAAAGGVKDERLTRAARAAEESAQRARIDRATQVLTVARALVEREHLLPDDLAEQTGADINDLVVGLREAEATRVPALMLVGQVKVILRWLRRQPFNAELQAVVDGGAALLEEK